MQLADYGERVLGPQRYYRIRAEDVAAKRTPEERTRAISDFLAWVGGPGMASEADAAGIAEFIARSSHAESFDVHERDGDVADWTRRVAGPMLQRFGYAPSTGGEVPERSGAAAAGGGGAQVWAAGPATSSSTASSSSVVRPFLCPPDTQSCCSSHLHLRFKVSWTLTRASLASLCPLRVSPAGRGRALARGPRREDPPPGQRGGERPPLPPGESLGGEAWGQRSGPEPHAQGQTENGVVVTVRRKPPARCFTRPLCRTGAVGIQKKRAKSWGDSLLLGWDYHHLTTPPQGSSHGNPAGWGWTDGVVSDR